LLDRGQDEFIKTLEEMIRGEPLPEPVADQPDAEGLLRAGVHPGSRALEQRVRKRMLQLDADESEYPRILEQILGEEV
jgi:hypothetical protein